MATKIYAVLIKVATFSQAANVVYVFTLLLLTNYVGSASLIETFVHWNCLNPVYWIIMLFPIVSGIWPLWFTSKISVANHIAGLNRSAIGEREEGDSCIKSQQWKMGDQVLNSGFWTGDQS